MRRTLAPLLTFALFLGCGGNGAPSSSAPSSSSNSTTVSVGKGKGKAVLTIEWPVRATGRLIPNAASEITVNLLQGATVVAVARIPRPAGGATTTSTTFAGLAYGTYTVWAQAFPNADGSGVAQAYGGGAMTVTEDVPGSLGVALDSSVVSLAIVPAAPVVVLGSTTTLTASAKDANGNVVLLAANGASEALTWTSDSPAIATVSGTGPNATLTGVATGTARLTATLRIDDAGDVVSTSPTAVSVPPLSIAASDVKTLAFYQGNTVGSGVAGLVGGIKDGNEDTGVSRPDFTSYSWRALFPLAGIPAGATIQSATITTSILSTQGYHVHHCSAYQSASGTVTFDNTTGFMSLTTTSISVGARSIDATAAVRANLAAGSPYLGFQITDNDNYSCIGIVTWNSPTLTVTFTAP